MKVLVQNRIDWFTVVQLSALAAFQGEQTDGRLSKNLEEEGEKKKAQSFSRNSPTSVVRHEAHIGTIQVNFLQCFWVSLCSFSKCNNKGKTPKHTQLKQTAFISGFAPLTQARHRVTRQWRRLCSEKLILIRFVSSGPWLLSQSPLYLLTDGTCI